MRKLLSLVLLVLAIAVGDAQNVSQPTGTARRIVRAASLPATCTVGDVYFKTAATVGTYQCLTTNAWTAIATAAGATIPSVANIIKGDGAGNGADTKVAVTSPTTAATLVFGTDNATLTFQGTGTVVNRDSTDTLTNKTLTSPTLTTPALGVASATTVNKVAITAPATSATLTIPDGVTLNAGAGGTLGSNAFTSTAYAALASPTFTGTVTQPSFNTTTNCANAASPAACGSAAAGTVAIPTGVTTVALVVNTTAVTANSRIFLMSDDSVTIAATTCNNTLATLVGGLAVTARTPGTSFTVTYNGTIATNPLCVCYHIIN